MIDRSVLTVTCCAVRVIVHRIGGLRCRAGWIGYRPEGVMQRHNDTALYPLDYDYVLLLRYAATYVHL